MTLPTHLALGGIIGALTGQPMLALGVSALIDVDHLGLYFRHGILKDPAVFWRTITRTVDPYQGQRGHLHSVFSFGVVALFSWILVPAYAMTLAVSHAGHLVLDALDDADYWPLHPFKHINIRGPIGFFSNSEWIVLGGLIIINVALWL